MESDSNDSAIFSKLLLGPGPSNVPDRILKAMSNNCISHLDPDFFDILDQISWYLMYTKFEPGVHLKKIIVI